MNNQETAKFRATTGPKEAFGTTPQEALNSLLQYLSGDSYMPIVIWPYNLGDAYFTDAQQTRLQDLKGRQETLTAEEREELEGLIEASFEATISRTKALTPVKT